MVNERIQARVCPVADRQNARPGDRKDLFILNGCPLGAPLFAGFFLLRGRRAVAQCAGGVRSRSRWSGRTSRSIECRAHYGAVTDAAERESG